MHALLHPLLDPFPGGSRAQCPRLLGPSVWRSARSDASSALASPLGAAAEVGRSPDAAHRSDREVDAANSNYDRLCVLSRFLSQSAISANLAPSSANGNYRLIAFWDDCSNMARSRPRSRLLSAQLNSAPSKNPPFVSS